MKKYDYDAFGLNIYILNYKNLFEIYNYILIDDDNNFNFFSYHFEINKNKYKYLILNKNFSVNYNIDYNNKNNNNKFDKKYENYEITYTDIHKINNYEFIYLSYSSKNFNFNNYK
jgi:hypothetical protein